MDIKWKNRIGLIIWLLFFAYGISGTATGILNGFTYYKNNYFQTSQFQNTVDNFTEYLHAFEIVLPQKEEIMKNITLSKGEIEEYRYQNGELTDQISEIEGQYQNRIEEALANNDQESAQFYRAERDKKIDEVSTNFNNDEYTIEKMKHDKKTQIENYFTELEESKEDYKVFNEAFVYELKNTKSGKTLSNLSGKKSINEKEMYNVQSYPTKKHQYLILPDIPYFDGYEEVQKLTKTKYNNLWEGKIAVSKSIPETNPIMQEYHNYNQERTAFLIITIGAVIALLVSILVGKKTNAFRKLAPKKWQDKYNKIPLDLAFASLVVFFPLTSAVIETATHLYLNFYLDDSLVYLFWLTVLIGLTSLQIIYFYPRAKRLLHDREEWNNTLTVKTLHMFRKAFLNRRTGTQLLIILIIIFCWGIGTALIFYEPELLIIYIPASLFIGLPVIILLLKSTGYFNQISINASSLAKGEFEPDLRIKGKSVLAKLAADINQMKHGVKTSQHAQAKSERLKTELITNVSHDLRTPLTSIITYTELLKNPDLLEDERKSYLEIIDRKSKRLKVLIDDLFEASKMASGNIKLVKERVDIVQLLQQSLAEYSEAMEESPIQFRITNLDHPVYAYVDGQKLWRVFDNVIGNMLKYSLEHTRAYILVTEEKDQVKISFKNISKYELSEDSDELFERFKRGDKSRHTDGSGLGLAIAKSIMDLHDGSMDIDVDGDLFKVTISMEKIKL